jgi:uncharacterized protein
MAKGTQFEIYKDKKGHYRWRLLASNGESVASGEGYADKRGATMAAKNLKKWSATETIVDKTVMVKPAKVAKKK